MQKAKNIIIAAAGGVILTAGVYFMTAVDHPLASVTALPYVCIGVGCGAMAYGTSNLVTDRLRKRNPCMQKQEEINRKDERNTALSHRAKAKAYDLTIFLFSVLIIAFVLLGVDMVPILVFVSAYLFVLGYAFYCRCRYEKEM